MENMGDMNNLMSNAMQALPQMANMMFNAMPPATFGDESQATFGDESYDSDESLGDISLDGDDDEDDDQKIQEANESSMSPAVPAIVSDDLTELTKQSLGEEFIKQLATQTNGKLNLKPLGRFKAVIKIDIQDDAWLNEAALVHIVNNVQLGSCQEVNLSGCPNITDNSLFVLGQALNKARYGLRKLRLARCPGVTSHGLEHLLHLLPHLKELDIRHTSVGPWQVQWLADSRKLCVRKNTYRNSSNAITGYHANGPVRHESVAVVHSGTGGSKVSMTSIGHLLAYDEVAPLNGGVRVTCADGVCNDRTFNIVEADATHPACWKLLPREMGRVILPFNMADSVQEVAKTQADIITTKIAPKFEPSLRIENAVLSSSNKDGKLGHTVSYINAAEMDFRTGILTVFDHKNSQGPFLMFEEVVFPANEISFEVLAIGEKKKLIIIEPGKQRNVPFKQVTLEQGMRVEVKAYDSKGANWTYGLFVNGENIDNRQRGHHSYSRLWFTGLGDGAKLQFQNLNGFTQKQLDNLAGNIIPEAYNFEKTGNVSLCIDLPTGILTAAPNPEECQATLKGRLKSLNGVNDKNNVIRLKLLGETWAGVSVGIAPFDWRLKDEELLGFTLTEVNGGTPGDVLEMIVHTQEEALLHSGDTVKLSLMLNGEQLDMKTVECKWKDHAARVVLGIILDKDYSNQVQVLNWMPQPRSLMGEVPFLTGDEFLITRDCTIQQNYEKTLRPVYGKGILEITEGIISHNSLTRSRPEFSVKIMDYGKEEGPDVSIGVSHYSYHYQRMPGWLPFSIGLDTEHGKLYSGSPVALDSEPVITTKDSVVTCGFDVSLVTKWTDNIPAPNQTLMIYWKVDGEEKIRWPLEYAGGGVHALLGMPKPKNQVQWINKIEHEVLAERLAEHAAGSSSEGHAEEEVTHQPGLHIVHLGLTSGDCPATASLEEFESAIREATLNCMNEKRKALGNCLDEGAYEDVAWTGELWRNKVCLEELSSSLEHRGSAIEVNTDTLKGVSELRSLLGSFPPMHYLPMPLLKMVDVILSCGLLHENILTVADVMDEVKGMLGDEDMDMRGSKLTSILEILLYLLHYWGLIVKCDDYVVLNKSWLAKVLRDVLTEAGDNGGKEKVVCVHADTPLWADRSLLSMACEFTPLHKLKPLLKILLSWKQCLQIPALTRTCVEDIKYYLLPPSCLQPLPQGVNLEDYWTREMKEAENVLACRVAYNLHFGLEDGHLHSVMAELLSVAQPVLLWCHGAVWFHGAVQMLIMRDDDGALYLEGQCFKGAEKGAALPASEVLQQAMTLFHELVTYALAQHPLSIYNTQMIRSSRKVKSVIDKAALCSRHTFELPCTDVGGDTACATSVCSLCQHCAASTSTINANNNNHGGDTNTNTNTDDGGIRVSTGGVSCDFNRFRSHVTEQYMQCGCRSRRGDDDNDAPSPPAVVCWDCGVCKICVEKLQKYLGPVPAALPQLVRKSQNIPHRSLNSPFDDDNPDSLCHLSLAMTRPLNPHSNPDVTLYITSTTSANLESNYCRHIVTYMPTGLEKALANAQVKNGGKAIVLYSLKTLDLLTLYPGTARMYGKNQQLKMAKGKMALPIGEMNEDVAITVNISEPSDGEQEKLFSTRVCYNAMLWQSEGLITFPGAYPGAPLGQVVSIRSLSSLEHPCFSVEVHQVNETVQIGVVSGIHPREEPVGHYRASCALSLHFTSASNLEATLICPEGENKSQSIEQAIKVGDVILCYLRPQQAKMCVEFRSISKADLEKGSQDNYQSKLLGIKYIGTPDMDFYAAVSGRDSDVLITGHSEGAIQAWQQDGVTASPPSDLIHTQSVDVDWLADIGRATYPEVEISPADKILFAKLSAFKALENTHYSYIYITNTHYTPVAYKVKVTNPKAYLVRPNKGVLAVKEKIVLDVRFKELMGTEKDKVMVQVCAVEDMNVNMDKINYTQKHVLLCSVTDEQLPSIEEAKDMYMDPISGPIVLKPYTPTTAFYRVEVSQQGEVIRSISVPRQDYLVGILEPKKPSAFSDPQNTRVAHGILPKPKPSAFSAPRLQMKSQAPRKNAPVFAKKSGFEQEQQQFSNVFNGSVASLNEEDDYEEEEEKYRVTMYMPSDRTEIMKHCSKYKDSHMVQQTTLARLRQHVQQWRYPLLEEGTGRPLIYLALPQPLTPAAIMYPNLHSLTDAQKLAVHTPCKCLELRAGVTSPIHLINTPGKIPTNPLTATQCFSSWVAAWSYADMAVTKCLLPAYDQLILCEEGRDDGGSCSRPQLETHLARIMHFYTFLSFLCQQSPVPLEQNPVPPGAKKPGLSRRRSKIQKENRLHMKLPISMDGEQVYPLMNDEEHMAMDYLPGEEFTDPHELADGQCLAHRNAIQPISKLDGTATGQQGGIEPVEKWFNAYTEQVTQMILDGTNMTTLEQSSMEQFCNLQVLELHNMEKLECLPEPMTSWSTALRKLHVIGQRRLQSLFTHLPEDLPECHELQDLVVKCTELTSLPAELFAKCRQLSRVIAHTNKLVALPERIAALSNLVYVDLNLNMLCSLPKEFAHLKALQVLKLGGVPWHAGMQQSYSIYQFNSWMTDHPQTMKLLSQEKLVALYKSCNLGNVTGLGSREMGDFNAHLYYAIARFGHDYVDGDEDGGIPSVIFELTNLRQLQLSSQAIRFVPEAISRLRDLTDLTLSHCPLLESLPGSLGSLQHISKLGVRGCPSLKTPPMEIVSRGVEATQAYLRRMHDDTAVNFTTKLMFVGLGGAGKTSLLRALKSDKKKTREAEPDEQITDGIDIDKWSVKHEQSGNIITYSTWDFAGQTVYYNTHQFFLTESAVYLLLWTTRLGYEHAGLDFWLSSIQCHAPNAPIFIVGTHCDKVETSSLPQHELQQKYPQIKGFHYVSSITGHGIQDLQDQVLAETLNLSFIGAKVPSVYLKLDAQIQLKRREKSVLAMDEVKELCLNVAIDRDVAEALQFLHALGSIQYFDNDVLRDHVVINPQWIVDVMACVVSVKNSPIKDGRFLREDMKTVWKEYPEELHDWMLGLTEVFDLTFPMPKEPCNLVPARLPHVQPEFDWPELKEGMKETLIYYRFAYLPAGLFNRAQVRLFQFSDGKIIWKSGSLLRKSGHLAIVKQINHNEMSVMVQGQRPDNILFMVHEVIESLILESFHGVEYQYLVPCPDCLRETGTDQPCMFEATLVRDAVKMNAPFIQCRKAFHTVSMPILQAIMPPDSRDSSKEFVAQLEQSVMALQDILSTDAFISYTAANIPDPDNTKAVHPNSIVQDLRAAGYKVWYQSKMDELSVQQMMMSLKDSKVMIVLMSCEYARDDNCRKLFLYAKEKMRKPYIIVSIGPNFKWQQGELGYQIGAGEVYVDMGDKSRYDSKIVELKKEVKKKMEPFEKGEKYCECFLSYCWSNSHEAIAKGSKNKSRAGLGPDSSDPRKIQQAIEAAGISCWLDINKVGKEGLFKDIHRGIKNAKVVVACVSEQYSKSKNCMMEFSFASCTLELPVIIVVVGKGDEWMSDELGMLKARSKAQIINFQTDSPENMEHLLEKLRTTIESVTEERNKMAAAADSNDSRFQSGDDGEDGGSTDASMEYKEEYELAQRKFLRHISALAGKMDTILYPRLFLLDFAEEEACMDQAAAVPAVPEETEGEGDGGEEKVATKVTESTPQRPKSARKPPLTSRRSTLARRDSVASMRGETNWMERSLCIKVLCEHEQGWHWVSDTGGLDHFVVESGEVEELVSETAAYWDRVTDLLKYSSMPLNMNKENLPDGMQLKEYMAEKASSGDLYQAYIKLRERVINMDDEKRRGGLKRCYLPTGLIRWLCPEHQKGHRITVLNDSKAAAGVRMVEEDDIALTEAILRHRDTLGAPYRQEREPRKLMLEQEEEHHNIWNINGGAGQNIDEALLRTAAQEDVVKPRDDKSTKSKRKEPGGSEQRPSSSQKLSGPSTSKHPQQGSSKKDERGGGEENRPVPAPRKSLQKKHSSLRSSPSNPTSDTLPMASVAEVAANKAPASKACTIS